MMTKKCLVFIFIFFTSACTGYTQQNAVSENQFSLQSEALVEAIANTPYSALIRITLVNPIDLPTTDNSDDYYDQKIIYHADVIETYRGNAKKNIAFTMYTEKGEELSFPQTPFIITLCQSNEEFYWPGVGAVFSADTRLRNIAKKIAKKADKTQLIFEDCE